MAIFRLDNGKSTFLENIIAQDLTRRFGTRKMPMIIFDGKGEREFLDHLLPHIAAAGRLQDLRILDPTHPAESCRYNPFYSLDDAYQEHVNFIFRSFGLREDFFKGHQEAYLSDLVRVLQYTGKLFNVYDVLVMALDDQGVDHHLPTHDMGDLRGEPLGFEWPSVRRFRREPGRNRRYVQIEAITAPRYLRDVSFPAVTQRLADGRRPDAGRSHRPGPHADQLRQIVF